MKGLEKPLWVLYFLIINSVPNPVSGFVRPFLFTRGQLIQLQRVQTFSSADHEKIGGSFLSVCAGDVLQEAELLIKLSIFTSFEDLEL